MNIGIIDADLIGRNKHRFPNLACEKISAYWKSHGSNVTLLTDYNNINLYDHVYISKVFTDTPFPEYINADERIHLGGTGFYFDEAQNLPDEIEHHMPDYHLYDDWISMQRNQLQFKEYTDYSIGFMTRGCFRKCGFCVNKKYSHVFAHSPLEEFYDPERKKICLLDDNILGYPHWKKVLQELIETKHPFKFKQGLDERLLTDEKCEMIFSSKYDGDYTFAFDSIKDYDLIADKLNMIRRYTNRKNIKFYVLCGYESVDIIDIENLFRRIELLMRYQCLPYIMRYQSMNTQPWKNSEFTGLYTQIARWCNQPSIFKKKSLREFCTLDQTRCKTKCSSIRAIEQLQIKYPDLAKKYLDLKYLDYS